MIDCELDYELTEEHYKIADRNGVPRYLVKQRFNAGWDVEKSITQPKGNTGYLKKLQAQAKENGIELSVHTISSRKRKGWTNEQIITTSTHGKVSHLKPYIELASESGIGKCTFYSRLYRGWDKKKAATEPVRTEHRRHL